MLVVIDTNVLVSAFWSKNGTPAKILDLLLNGRLKLCYDHRILMEYRTVLQRPRFGFSDIEVETVMQILEATGHSVVPVPLDTAFLDETDKKFYEVAKFCDAKLITGNLKHFPQETNIVSPADFLKQL